MQDMNRKKIIFSILTLTLLLVCVSACQAANLSQAGEKGSGTEQAKDPFSQTIDSESVPDGETMIYAHIGDSTLTIRPENNSSAEAFVEVLRNSDITVDMHDYGGFEKVGPLGMELPTNDERITTEPGDVILYQGNQITVYYDNNTWSFTRLGKVQDQSPSELKDILGSGNATATFSLNYESR